MSNKVVVIAEARMGSGRLPNKSATLLAGKASIVRAVERYTEMFHVDQVIGLFPCGVLDDPLEAIALYEGWDVFRGSLWQGARRTDAFRHFDLAPNDIWVLATGDGPLAYTDWMPDVIELMQEEGYDAADAIQEDGLFMTAVLSAGVVSTVGVWEHAAEYRFENAMVDSLNCMAYHFDIGKRIIVHIDDPYLRKPWPLAPLSIDYPKQAVVMKRIFDQFYDGHPIDVRDVYRMVMDNPFLQGFIGPIGMEAGVLLGDQPNFPMGFGDLTVAEMKKAPLGYTEISYKGGAYTPKPLPKWEDTIPLYEREET